MIENEISLETILKELSETLPKFPDGRINYSNCDKAVVITCFVKFQDKILLLKRSDKVRTEQGLWNTVSGYIDKLVPIEQKAYEELEEELGVTADMIEKTKLGKPYEFVDKNANITWVIFPAIVELNVEPVIRLDWEHTEYRWINPSELRQYEIVPDLDNTLSKVLD